MGDRECVVVEYRANESATSRLWVDPARECAILRAVENRDGRAATQIDIAYTRHADQRWVPQEWTTMVFSDEMEYPGRSSLFQTAFFQVVDTAVNEPIPADRFDIEIPRPAIVNDESNGRTYKVAHDGASQVVPAQELATLFSAFPGVTRPVHGADRYTWNVVAGIAVVVIAASFMIWRRRARGPRT
jgi:hypothetical protein